MRAPAPMTAAASFPDQLAAYRKALLDGAPDDRGRKLITSTLDNWGDHPDAEEIWRKITTALNANKAPPMPASLFIATIIRMRVECERLRAWIEPFRPGAERLPGTERLRPGMSHALALTSKAKKEADREWRSDESLAISATAKRIAAKGAEENLTAVLGRKKTRAPQRRFMLTLRDWFIDNCGKPFNEIVATLAEIAFGEDFSAQNVRDAVKPTRQDIRRKNRPRMSPKKKRGLK
jgi:hypothetical protein